MENINLGALYENSKKIERNGNRLIGYALAMTTTIILGGSPLVADYALNQKTNAQSKLENQTRIEEDSTQLEPDSLILE